MRGTVDQMKVPQKDRVSKKALLRVLGVSLARADAAGSVSVPGAGWVSTGISVTAGDVLTIRASGQSEFRFSPSGNDRPLNKKI